MLRRRMMMLMQGGYRWAIGKIGMVMGRSAAPIAAPAEDAQSRRAVTMGRRTNAEARPVVIGINVGTMQMGQSATPDVHDAAEAKTARRIVMGWLANAYSALIAEGKGLRRIVMGRKSEALAAPSVHARRVSKMLLGRKSGAIHAPAEEAYSKKGIVSGVISDAESADGRPVSSGRVLRMGRSAEPIIADPILTKQGTGIQTGAYAKSTFWIEPYYENGLLVIRQAYNAEEINDVLEVR